jgi:ergothioneine biosynthesis protein EgtB
MPTPERSNRQTEARAPGRNIGLVEPASAALARESLPQYFARVRARTLALAARLSEEDCCVQSMPDASPAKWHLGHTSWFFETFILERFESGFRPFHEAFRVMFNSYYNGVGDKHPRAQRGMLTRPPLSAVRDYRSDVEERMQRLLAARGSDAKLQELVILGLNHEQQHQELLLTDIKHLLSLSPLKPAYHDQAVSRAAKTPALSWQNFEGGLTEIGSEGTSFCFDNELPRHRVFLESFALAPRLVTNGEYLDFIEQGAYRDPRLWLAEGWDWVNANRLAHPLYWSHDKQGWKEFSLSGMVDLDPELPAVHLSYFEADAYARWAGARLPTEAELEVAAAGPTMAAANFADSGRFHPAAATGDGLTQIYGDAWEWTRSSYAPYPGFRESEGAIGEYNGKFMVNQYVLRGGSCATPADHMRASYRNFFPAAARWQFSGIRLARDPR